MEIQRQTAADLLKRYIAAHPAVPIDAQQQEKDHFDKLCKSLDAHSLNDDSDPSYKVIPRFFTKKTNTQKEHNPIALAVRKVHYQLVAQKKAETILTNDDLDLLWDKLEHKSTKSEDGNGKLSYPAFCEIAKECPKFADFLKPSLFLNLSKREEPEGIDCQILFNFILRKASLIQERICISVYDRDCDGFLTIEEFQKYIEDLVPSFPHVKSLEQEFSRYYLQNVMAKFLFHLDVARKGKIDLKDLLSSPVLAELFELQQDDLAPHTIVSNWFSMYSALKVYNQFQDMDTDKNGYLNPDELAKFMKRRYVREFLDRIFQEYPTVNGELDYKGYLNLVIALSDLNNHHSISFCFRLLDINNQGYLDYLTVHYFVKAVSQRLSTPIEQKYFINEIFDMATSKEFGKITLKDMIKCGVGGAIISLLIDVQTVIQSQAKE